MESQNSESKVSTTQRVKTAENHAVSNGLRGSLRELFPLPTIKDNTSFEDEKALIELMNEVLDITKNDSKLCQQFDRFVHNFQPETPSVASPPQPTSDTKANPYAVKNTLLLGVPPGSEWSTFAVQWRRFNSNLLKQALDTPAAQKEDETISYLPEQDMDMFGYSPLDDDLQLVRCNFCNKPLRTSRFSQHLAQCPAKNRTDSKQASDVLVRNDMYNSTELNGADTKDEVEAKPVLAKRKITDTSFKIPKKNPAAEQPVVPTPKAASKSKKSKPSPPSNGEAHADTVPAPAPVESPVKPSKKKSSAEAPSSQKERKTSKKQQASDNNNKSSGMIMFNSMSMMPMQNYAYQQQMAALQAQQANGNMQPGVNTPNRAFVNTNIKYLPQQVPMQQHANNNNANNSSIPTQYVNMSLINNFQGNPMLASQYIQNQQMQAQLQNQQLQNQQLQNQQLQNQQLQNQQLQNQQYAMLAASNAQSAVLKKPSNKKPRKKGENDSTDSQGNQGSQPSQGIIYVTPQQNQLQQQMYANHMNNMNMQLLLQRQQQLQLMASKGMLSNTINMNMNQPNAMGGVNPNVVMGMNNSSMAAMNNPAMAVNATSGPNMNTNMGNINNMTVNNTNMASINPMMASNSMNIQQNANTANTQGPNSPPNMQQRVSQKNSMAPQGTHTHVQQTQTQTINMTPQQYQQITQQQLQQLQQLQLLQQQQNMQMLQSMNAAQQGKGQPRSQTPTKMTAITPNAQMMSPNGNIMVSSMNPNQMPKGTTPVYNIKPNNPAPSKATTTPPPKPSVPKAIQGSNSAVTDAGTKQPGWHSFVIKTPNSAQPQASPVNNNNNSNQPPYIPPRPTVVQMPPPLPQYPLPPSPAQAVTGIPVMLPESQTP